MITSEELKNKVLEKGNFDKEKNEYMYNKFFLFAQKTLERMSRYLDFSNKKILDVGCGYGDYLIHFGENSLGVECREDAKSFCKKLGMRVVKMNIEDDFLSINEKFDMIFCRQVLDHLVSPHKFLIESHKLLKDDGKIMVCIDNIYSITGFKLPEEHLSGFCIKSTEIALKKAGFIIEKVFTLTVNKPVFIEKLFNKIPFLLAKSQDLYFIGKKDPNFAYGKKRIKEFTPSWL